MPSFVLLNVTYAGVYQGISQNKNVTIWYVVCLEISISVWATTEHRF